MTHFNSSLLTYIIHFFSLVLLNLGCLNTNFSLQVLILMIRATKLPEQLQSQPNFKYTISVNVIIWNVIYTMEPKMYLSPKETDIIIL